MLDPHVFGHGVASIGTASQRQRRRELEVVEIADSPVRGSFRNGTIPKTVDAEVGPVELPGIVMARSPRGWCPLVSGGWVVLMT